MNKSVGTWTAVIKHESETCDCISFVPREVGTPPAKTAYSENVAATQQNM
jgi:hypothetical protein